MLSLVSHTMPTIPVVVATNYGEPGVAVRARMREEAPLGNRNRQKERNAWLNQG